MLRHARVVALCSTVFLFMPAPAAAQPGRAVLVAPAGEIMGPTIVFTWHAVPTSTWYLLWIGTSTGAVLQQWYTADQARCLNVGACSVTLTLGIGPGAYSWFIQTWNPTGTGPWSLAKGISVRDLTPTWSRKLPIDRRYTLVLDDAAVLDNETGLTWERAPQEALANHFSASARCDRLFVGGRMGWRLPTLSELLSVTDPNTTLGLAPGHPFTTFGFANSPFVWTNTGDRPGDYSFIKFVQINQLTNRQAANPDVVAARPWCVRGAGSIQ